MRLKITNDFDQKLTELYMSQVTVNLDAKSTMNPNEFWSSMELIAVNRKAMMNFRIAR
ncbi:MAG: hypothetical protein IJD57_04060 [Candidatus Gastranaerophilales bacterium]|nr:hypothetical protein [Candidatus Gastranaerophilales bacterium]